MRSRISGIVILLRGGQRDSLKSRTLVAAEVHTSEQAEGRRQRCNARSQSTSKQSTQTMATNVDKYFQFEHLPEHVKEISKPIAELAKLMNESLPDGAEKSAGMRKLLEAKDCFVRARLD